MSKIRIVAMIAVFALVAWALFYGNQFAGLVAWIFLGCSTLALAKWIASIEPSKLRQRDIEKQGFHVEFDSPGVYRGADIHDFGLTYHEPDGKISFEGTWPPKSKAILTVPSPNLWEIKMPDWAKSRRAVILERIAKAYRFMIIQEDSSTR